jgi:hypothetical protein
LRGCYLLQYFASPTLIPLPLLKGGNYINL